MSDSLRVVVFDVDGTLVNSRAHILTSMQRAFNNLGRPEPSDAEVLHGIGLSLPELMAHLAPDASADTHHALAARYKEVSLARHSSGGGDAEAPLYPGLRDILDRLHRDDVTLLATATGKSRRGMRRMITHHGLEGYFQSTQVADDHPSKPHPSMLLTVLAETGVAASHAVMVGDTSYDMSMGRSAGLATIGVGWGYHRASDLDADYLVHTAGALSSALDQWNEGLA